MKQTFEIPKGCNRVTIEQQGNKIVTTFEPEFKEGDILFVEEYDDCRSSVFIFKKNINNEKNDIYVGVIDGMPGYTLTGPIYGFPRHATESEKQQLFNALAKEGKQWNAEKMCIEDLKPKRWRAEYGCRYYFAMPYDGCLGYCSECIDYRSGEDNKRHKAGNYFKTKAEANSAGLKMKELLKQINP